MKKFTNKILALAFVLTMLCTTLGGLVVSALEPVVVENLGFELGALTGWTSSKGTAEVVSDEKAEGSYSMHFPSANIQYNTPFIPVEAGATYYFSYQVKTAVANRLDLYYFDANGTQVGSTVANFLNPTGTGVWTKMAKTFTVPAGATQVKLRAMAPGNGGEAWWDDFSLAKLGEEVDMGEAVVNGGMETVTAGTPDGWAFSGTATATIDTTDKKAGTNSLKVVNTEGDFVASKSCLIDNRVKRLVSVYFNLTEIGEGANGVKLSVYDLDGTLKAETSYFKAIGKGWRKALVILPANSTSLEVTVKLTVSGAATVYFDELSSIGSDAIIDNGDLTGMTSDLTPAGWQKFVSSANTGTVDTVESLPVSNGSNGFEIISDAEVGTCLKMTATSRGLAIWWPNVTNDVMEKGARYKLTFDYKGADVSLIHTAQRTKLSGSRDQVSTGSSTVNWTEIGQLPASETWVRGFAFYFTYDTGTLADTYDYNLHIVGRYPTEANPDYIANISLEKVEDTDKVEITQSGSTLTAEYTGFSEGSAINWSKALINGELNTQDATTIVTYGDQTKTYTQTRDEKATLLFALYEKIGDALKLSAVETESGSPVYAAYPRNSAQYQLMPVNERPVVLTKSFDLSEYPDAAIAKAFVWNDVNAIEPYIGSETLEITR